MAPSESAFTNSGVMGEDGSNPSDGKGALLMQVYWLSQF
jgi:hypothetical protein